MPSASAVRAFITGTDTSVGKTFATALLTRSLRAAGCPAVAVKPVCTGDRDDVDLLRAASDHTLDADSTNPVHLREPAAPLVAARLEGRTLELDSFAAWFKSISSRHPSVLVEGAGGWLVPLTPSATIADLAALLGLPVIPVVANRLGCINHTLLTLESIRSRGLRCPGIILNHAAPALDAATRTNRDILASHTEVLLEIGHNQQAVPADQLAPFFLLQ